MRRRVRASCWIDHTGDFGERVYGSPVGSTGLYAIGLHGVGSDPPIAHDTPYLAAESDPLESADRIRAYVRRVMPGLDPDPVEARMCVTTTLPWGDDTFAVWQEERATFIAGTNMFKFAPVLGTVLADAVLSGRVPAQLAPSVSPDALV
jgi:sarcosine oxidase